MKVYVINIDLIDVESPTLLTNEAFKQIAEKDGLVFSLLGFQDAFNDSFISTENCFIRICE